MINKAVVNFAEHPYADLSSVQSVGGAHRRNTKPVGVSSGNYLPEVCHGEADVRKYFSFVTAKEVSEQS